MTRAAMAGDIAGSRFERSIWQGETFLSATCVGYDQTDVLHDASGESASAFPLFQPACHPTDDSILTVAVMEWLLQGGDPRTSLRQWYRASSKPMLFGTFFRAWAATDSDSPCGSIGNGAAMRAAPIGYAADHAAAVLELARENAMATHTTPDAIAGAQAIALGVFLARQGFPPGEIVREIAARFHYNLEKPLDAWRIGYRFTSACEETVPVAFRAFLESHSHTKTMRAAISVGGDADTIACMAGGLAGACWGIPRGTADKVRRLAGPLMFQVVQRFEERFPGALKLAEHGTIRLVK